MAWAIWRREVPAGEVVTRVVPSAFFQVTVTRGREEGGDEVAMEGMETVMYRLKGAFVLLDRKDFTR